MSITKNTKKTKSSSTTKSPTKKPSERKGVADQGARPGSKQAAILAQLCEPGGATIAAIDEGYRLAATFGARISCRRRAQN